jgi:hypothetical protein
MVLEVRDRKENREAVVDPAHISCPMYAPNTPMSSAFKYPGRHQPRFSKWKLKCIGSTHSLRDKREKVVEVDYSTIRLLNRVEVLDLLQYAPRWDTPLDFLDPFIEHLTNVKVFRIPPRTRIRVLLPQYPSIVSSIWGKREGSSTCAPRDMGPSPCDAGRFRSPKQCYECSTFPTGKWGKLVVCQFLVIPSASNAAGSTEGQPCCERQAWAELRVRTEPFQARRSIVRLCVIGSLNVSSQCENAAVPVHGSKVDLCTCSYRRNAP